MSKLRSLSRFCVAAERIGNSDDAFKALSQIAPDFTLFQLTVVLRFLMFYEAGILKSKLLKEEFIYETD